MTCPTTSFARLSDDQLLAEVTRLAATERHATAALVRSLLELDARRLYLGEGCSSLFTYCTQVLHLAEGAAYNRIEAARAARRFPSLLDALEDGSLTLTAVRLLAPHLTPENSRDVLAAARYKSKADIERLVASLHPKPPAATLVRKLPQPRREVTPASAPSAPPSPTPEPEAPATPAVAAELARPAPRAVVAPLAPERYRVQLTISRETYDKLRRVQALVRHTIPTGDPAEIFDRALTLLLNDLERRRCAAVASPRAPNARQAQNGDRSRHIPAAVRREVWRRDEGRCAFVGRGGRCTETTFLEYHHVRPYAAGGEPTTANIELRCRTHNAYEAALFFGRDGASAVREARVLYSCTGGDKPPGRWR
jgi:5-methylcytosine-specific restriction endonuclease McrA